MPALVSNTASHDPSDIPGAEPLTTRRLLQAPKGRFLAKIIVIASHSPSRGSTVKITLAKQIKHVQLAP